MCAFYFLFLRFYTQKKWTSLHFKQDWFTYLVQNIIPQTVLSVQVRGQEWVGGKKRIKNIFSIAAKHPGTQPLLESKTLAIMPFYKYFYIFKGQQKTFKPKQAEESALEVFTREMTLSPQGTILLSLAKWFWDLPSTAVVAFTLCTQECRGCGEWWQMNHKQWAANNNPIYKIVITFLSSAVKK